ncbi:FAD-dependent oxidoreductase [soil metagenome]
MEHFGKHTSYWIDSTKQKSHSTLSSNIEIDVAVIGGGIAGVSCAYMLSQQGKKVAIIEAEQIGQGVTGFTTAHITSEHNLMYEYLINKFGINKAQLYANANETTIKTIENIIVKEKIPCDFKRVSQYLFCEMDQDIQKLKNEYAAAKQLSLHINWKDTLPLPFPIHGAIEYKEQAQFHPRKYILGLAEKIISAGGLIFEKTRAIDVREGELYVIETDKGMCKAKNVIVATHFPFLDRGGFFARMKQDRSYVIGVHIDDDVDLDMYDNIADPYYYIRTQPTDNGLLVLIGGEDHTTGKDKDATQHYKNLEAYARQHFNIRSIEYYWSSQDTYPYDKVPFIGHFMPGTKHLYVATGFQGYGMTFGTVSGMLLTDMIMDKKNDWEELFTPQRFKPTAEIPSSIAGGLSIGKEFIFGKLAGKDKDEVEKMEYNSGIVITYEGKKIAVYKDHQGKLFAVSAICTHMGCTLNFNNAEASWDCPCHGSRFNHDGRILHGPAVKPLQKKHLS